MKLKVVIHTDPDGGFWAKVPALPGCVTEADTREELIGNLQEAIEGWLEVAARNHLNHMWQENPNGGWSDWDDQGGRVI